MSAGPRGLHVDATVEVDGRSIATVFDVVPGRVLALTGPPGAGTAIVEAVAGRLPLSAGLISIDGLIVSAGAERVPRRLRGVGAVLGDYGFRPRRSVSDVVAAAFRSRGTPKKQARADAEPWLERFELDHLADRRPAELTAWERMRLALARALAADPKVLVLDDPLAPLAPRDARDARAPLARLLHEFGRPVLLAAGDPDDLAALADDVRELPGWLPVEPLTRE